jgi:methylphosphotriester-DNA--protein-cysteine methyltransferase
VYFKVDCAAPWVAEAPEAQRIAAQVLPGAEHVIEYHVGTPPMQYLARWRMQLAASLLTGTRLPLMDVAQRVGYGSEAALSCAFKRLVGVAPSAWRDGQRPDSAFEPELSASEDDGAEPALTAEAE